MKQDILLICRCAKRYDELCIALQRFEMNVSQIEYHQGVLAGLALHSPAFLLLSLDKEDTKRLLSEITKKTLQPPPYIIVAGAFLSGTDRAAMLDLGADACVSEPVQREEILAVIRTVLRREGKIARLHLGRLLPSIKHKELMIDPLRKTVKMRGELVTLGCLRLRAGLAATIPIRGLSYKGSEVYGRRNQNICHWPIGVVSKALKAN